MTERIILALDRHNKLQLVDENDELVPIQPFIREQVAARGMRGLGTLETAAALEHATSWTYFAGKNESFVVPLVLLNQLGYAVEVIDRRHG